MNPLFVMALLIAAPADGAATSTTTSSVADEPPETRVEPPAEVPKEHPKEHPKDHPKKAPAPEKKSSVLPDSLELKLRGQYWARFYGTAAKGFAPVSFNETIGQRARLGATLTHDSGVAVSVLLQDVRTWGEETNTLNDFSANGFDLHEGWVQLPLFDGGKAKIGRQEVVIGNSRLIGNVGWLLRARSFDGARVDTAYGKLKTTLFYAKVTERDKSGDGSVPDGVESDRDLGIAHIAYKLGEKNTLTLTYIFDGTADGNRTLHTVGPTFSGKAGALAYSAEAFGQFGKVGDADKGAFLLAGRVAYTLDVKMKPQFFAFIDVLTSEGMPGTTFDTLYATNHKFYGEMDLYLNLPVHTSGLGLINPGAGVMLSPMKRVKLKLTYFDFQGFKEHAMFGRHFGDEIDVKLIVKLFDSVALRALYGIYIPGDASKARFGASADKLSHLVFVTLAAQL